MLCYTFDASVHVRLAIAKMVKAARDTGEEVSASIHGIEVVARPGEAASGILEYWKAQVEWRINQEYPALLQQVAVDALMEELLILDTTDLRAVLLWLGRLINSSQFQGGTVPARAILEFFAEHDLVPLQSAQCTAAMSNREPFARWVIGRCLRDLHNLGKVESSIGVLINRWLSLFPADP